MQVRTFFSAKNSLFSIVIFLFLFSQNSFSQNKGKYPALLWEITGNGLTKPSYLYGTMHVSNKLAFHLSDSFFIALKSADIIALETNPQEWLQNMKDMGMFDMTQDYSMFNFFGGGASGDFYKTAFKFEIPDNKELGSVLASDPDLVNGLLYRSNEPQGNHEENTYLDLFIFQSARKLGKPVTNLEDFKESEKMVQEAMVPDPNEEEAAQKYYKDMYDRRGNVQEKIEDAYRKGDLDALDSLSRLTYPSKKYEKYMLHLRNEIMVRGMDSIMKKQILFTGVGAAHLPGEKGVIELLRKKGFKVRAVNFKVSKNSMKEKEKIEQTVSQLTYSSQYAPDSSFKADIPGKFIETSKYGETRYYLCPEMINGAYFFVARIKTFAAFNGQDQEYGMKRLDSLFYENIPGKIIKNEKIKANNGWPGYDITSQTRRGDFQRYRVFVGPQEVFVFKMGGTGNFVKGSDGEKFFNSISFSDSKKTSWARYTPPNGGFSAELPPTILYEKPTNKKNTGAAEKLQAYDQATGDFYIAMRAYYNDFLYIEEDTFELNLLLNRFIEKKDFEVLEKKLNNFGKYPMLSAKLKDKNTGSNLFFNFYLRGPHYYMLGAKTKNNKYPEKYFNSFRFEDFKFTGKFKDSYDSSMYFTVNDEFDAIDENLLSGMQNSGLYNNYGEKKEKKIYSDSYEGKYLEKNFFSPSSNEAIHVEYRKFNDFRMEKSKEEFWKSEMDYLTKKNGLIIKDHKTTTSPDKTFDQVGYSERHEILLTDTASTRGIKVLIVMKDGVEYMLQANVDTLSPLSYWIDNFYKTFRPKDSAIGKNIFTDKLEILLNDLVSKDSSVRHAAENSGGELIIKKEQLNTLLKFVERPEYKGLSLEVKTWLIRRLGDISDDKVVAYLQKEYDVYEDTASIQFAILHALASQKKESATKVFLDLLKKETPLTSNDYEITEIFRPYYDSLVFAKSLFPGLLTLTKFSEYKSKIYTLLAALVDEGLLTASGYATEKAVIQNEANYELKRFKANEVNINSYDSNYGQNNRTVDYGDGESEEDYSYTVSSKSSKYYSRIFDRTDLENYALLLIPSYNDAQSKTFFTKINKTKNDYLLMNINLLLLKNKIEVNDTMWVHYSKSEKNRLDFYKKLEDIKRLEKFDSKYKIQEDFCRSLLYRNDDQYKDKDPNIKEEKDSIVFVAKKRMKNKTAEGYIYFFKRRLADKKEWKLDYVGIQPLDEKKVSANSRYQRKNLRLYEDKTIEEQMNEIISELNMRGRQRVSAGGDYGSYVDY